MCITGRRKRLRFYKDHTFLGRITSMNYEISENEKTKMLGLSEQVQKFLR